MGFRLLCSTNKFQVMSNFDFIPQNEERTEPDMNIVGLFLKAILKKGHYETYPMDGIMHRLTDAGEFVAVQYFSRDAKNYNFVRVLPCDIDYAWQVLKEKGYHVRKDGSMYCVDKVKWATREHRAGYYLF